MVLGFHEEHFVVLPPTHDKAILNQWVRRPAIDVVPAIQNLGGPALTCLAHPRLVCLGCLLLHLSLGLLLPAIVVGRLSGCLRVLLVCLREREQAASVRKRASSEVVRSPCRSRIGRTWILAGTLGSPKARDC